MTLTLNPDPEELGRLVEFIETFCHRHGLPDETSCHLNIALEELILNAMKHGRCNPVEGAIRLDIELAGDTLNIELSDTGVPFNPLDRPEPDLTGNIAERPIGGLGIHLVRSLMGSIGYQRREGRNYLHLTKQVPHAHGGT